VLAAVVAGATAMVATLDSVPSPTDAFGRLSGAIRQNMVQAEPDFQLPRPPAAVFPYGVDQTPQPPPSSSAPSGATDNAPGPAPRILGLRSDACLSQVPNPAVDPWNARLFEGDSPAANDSNLVAPRRQSAGCFSSTE
jgi:hypothetical protein